MKIIKNITSFNFLNISKYTVVLSLLLMISGLFSLFFKGINVSIDFTGGTVINIKIDEDEVNLSDLRLEIKNLLSQNVNIVETNLESEAKYLIITTEFLNSKNENLLSNFFTDKYNNNYTLLQIESIGAKLGDELRNNARNAIIISLLLIFSFRIYSIIHCYLK